jgi:hypothetical protein
VERDAAESAPDPAGGVDPLTAILRRVAADPAADESCREWASRLLNDEGEVSEGEQAGGAAEEATGPGRS